MDDTPDEKKIAKDNISDILSSGIYRAVENSSLKYAKQDDISTSKALMSSLGGLRGLAEAIIPGIIFVTIFTLSKNVIFSVVASLLAATVFTVLRVVAKTSITQALAGLFGVAISAFFALVSGRGEDNFILGIWMNCLYAAVFLISIFLRWPIIGIAAGYLMNIGTSWRKNKYKLRIFQSLTFLWFLLFAIRVFVQVPLYFAHTDDATAALGIAKLLMGLPLYVPLLLVTWLVIKNQSDSAKTAPAE